MIDFAGQVAVVTGSGRGLGRLYALEHDVGGTMHGDGSDRSVADLDRALRPSRCGREQRGHLRQRALRRALAGRLEAHARRPPGRRVPREPAGVPRDEGKGYGRFVFIASSAGLFGQPLEAHYAAAEAGLVGLTNVIVIEGAPHGILANSVLPFGTSRMVTETVAAVDDPKRLEESGFLKAIQPELAVPIGDGALQRADVDRRRGRRDLRPARHPGLGGS